MQAVLSIVLVAFMIFALVDVITRDNWRMRFMSKFGWVLVIVLLPLIGSILWFALGRERDGAPEAVSFGDPRREPVKYETSRYESITDDDEAAIENEIAFHEKQAEIRRLEATLRSKREQDSASNGELPA